MVMGTFSRLALWPKMCGKSIKTYIFQLFSASWAKKMMSREMPKNRKIMVVVVDTHKHRKKNSISFLFVDINKISPMNRIEQMKMAISYKDEAAKSAQRHDRRKKKSFRSWFFLSYAFSYFNFSLCAKNDVVDATTLDNEIYLYVQTCTVRHEQIASWQLCTFFKSLQK